MCSRCSAIKVSGQLSDQMTVDQVQQREKENPDDIDEVPVKADVFDGRVVVCVKAAFTRFQNKVEQQAGADDHVQSVKTGLTEIEREIQLSVSIYRRHSHSPRIAETLLFGVVSLRLNGFAHFLLFVLEVLRVQSARISAIGAIGDVKIAPWHEMMVKLLFVLDHLDAQENRTQHQRGDEPDDNSFFAAGLGGPNGHGHRETASDENDGVGEAEIQVQHVARDTERAGKFVAVDGVGEEEDTEEQNFRDQENPHAERGGFLLLL